MSNSPIKEKLLRFIMTDPEINRLIILINTTKNKEVRRRSLKLYSYHLIKAVEKQSKRRP